MEKYLIAHISERLSLSSRIIENTIDLLEGGATIPFIARYRKEAIGNIDEVAVSSIQAQLKQVNELIKRREFVLEAIDEQGKLTPDLRRAVSDCWDATDLEDIYLPYKQKRQTRATKARTAGLQPLAESIWSQANGSVDQMARKFVGDAYPTMHEVLKGAQDILAEKVSESRNARNAVRSIFQRKAIIRTKLIKGKESEGRTYQNYFDFEEPLNRCPSHRFLAMCRGEAEGILRLKVRPDQEPALSRLNRQFVKGRNQRGQLVSEAIEDAYKRLLAPSIETEVKNQAKTRADVEAIQVFAKNLRQLLLTPPLGEKRVLAIDPGFRSGCKLVCLSAQGELLEHRTVYPHPPQKQSEQARSTTERLIEQFAIQAVAIGNGTAGRETEQWLRTFVGSEIDLYMVNEDGASIYSASDLARSEFPDLDLTVRGAISIGRRLLDPLAELVKIDPKSIGVGQYQHDVDQKLLKESLDETVMSCVNSVGINLNTASASLLTYVSGIGRTTAANIVAHRNGNAPFASISELKKVKGIGAKAFEQSAGFLRLPGVSNPLDNTAVHPERYAIVRKMSRDAGASLKDFIGNERLLSKTNIAAYVAEDVGLPTLNDIISELKRPGLDPRGAAVAFEFAEGIKSIDDLQVGMTVPGKVTNVTKFGAFVDLGIKENGLIHVSQLADRFVSDPSEIISINEIVHPRVIAIDVERGRINLSLKDL